jgi:hypothetical protein
MSDDNTVSARALVSRRTATGKARTARNAPKHGLRARRLRGAPGRPPVVAGDAQVALRLLQAQARELPEVAAPDATPTILPPPRGTTKQTREVKVEQSFSS